MAPDRAGRRGTCVALLFALTLPLPAAGAQPAPAGSVPPLSVVLEGQACAAELRARLDAWDARLDGALADPPDPTGARRYRVPTGTLGVWVRLALPAEGDLIAQRVSAATLETHRVGVNCQLEVSREVRQGHDPAGGVFTDDALAARMAKEGRGVILLWSPHMPLSVDQFEELRHAARQHDLAVVVVLDPSADPAFARRVASERGLPDEAVVPLDGVELAFRGMTTHAPSVQVFAGGRLVGPVLYGYRDRATAALTLARVLKSAAGR